MNKKTICNFAVAALCVTSLTFSVAAFTEAKAAKAPNAPAAVAGQPVDLTYAADKALPCVVHIKYLQNSKVQEVEMQSDPFGDFFDPFGMFGQRGQGQNQRRKVQTPKKEGTNSPLPLTTIASILLVSSVLIRIPTSLLSRSMQRTSLLLPSLQVMISRWVSGFLQSDTHSISVLP